MRKQIVGYIGILLVLVLALTTINCQSATNVKTAESKQCPLVAMGVPCVDDTPGKVCPIAQGKDPCDSCTTKAKELQGQNEIEELDTQFAKHMEAKEYDKALDVISRIDKTLPVNTQIGYNPQVVNAKAYVYMVRGDYDKALDNYNQLLKTFPKDAGSLYNVTCIYSLKGSKQAACEYLGKAVQNGYNDWKHMDTDTDLNNIRNENEYKKLRGELEGRFPKGAMASPCQGCPSAQGCPSSQKTAAIEGCADCANKDKCDSASKCVGGVQCKCGGHSHDKCASSDKCDKDGKCTGNCSEQEKANCPQHKK